MTWAEDTLLHVNGPQQAIPSLQSGEKKRYLYPCFGSTAGHSFLHLH